MSINEMCTEFLWGNLKEEGYLENLGVDGRGLLKQILKK